MQGQYWAENCWAAETLSFMQQSRHRAKYDICSYTSPMPSQRFPSVRNSQQCPGSYPGNSCHLKLLNHQILWEERLAWKSKWAVTNQVWTRTADALMNYVREHIASVPRVKSHYGKATAKIDYVEGMLTMKKIITCIWRRALLLDMIVYWNMCTMILLIIKLTYLFTKHSWTSVI